jgi:EmrB/QacA subfamily drug resistance transporter
MPYVVKPLDKEALFARYGERYKWYVMAVVALGTIGAVLLSTGFNVAVPALMKHFGIGNEEVQLAVTSFMVANTVAMLPTPWLIQRFGLRRCFIYATVVLVVASLLGSLSPTFPLLLAARIAQGVAAGIMYPIGTYVIMWLFPASKQGRASGLLGFAIVLAPAVSPALGGILIDNFGWESVFFLSLPFSLLAWLGAWLLLPVPDAQKTADFDWLGMTLLSIMTMALLACVTHLKGGSAGNYLTLGETLLAVVALLWFLRHSARSPGAIISLEMFKHRPLAMGMTISFIYGFGIYGSTYLIPLYLQTVIGLSATMAGGVLVPGGLALALTLPLAGFLSDRTSPRLVVIAGLLLLAASFGGLWLVSAQNSSAHFIELTTLGRVGSGLIIASLSQSAMQGIHGHLLGQAAMFIGYIRQLGGVLGVACLAVFVGWRSAMLGGSSSAHCQAFAEGFLLSLLIFIVAALAAYRMKEPPQEVQETN